MLRNDAFGKVLVVSRPEDRDSPDPLVLVAFLQEAESRDPGDAFKRAALV